MICSTVYVQTDVYKYLYNSSRSYMYMHSNTCFLFTWKSTVGFSSGSCSKLFLAITVYTPTVTRGKVTLHFLKSTTFLAWWNKTAQLWEQKRLFKSLLTSRQTFQKWWERVIWVDFLGFDITPDDSSLQVVTTNDPNFHGGSYPIGISNQIGTKQAETSAIKGKLVYKQKILNIYMEVLKM